MSQDKDPRIAALQARGAARIDPAGWQQVLALTRRMAAQDAAVQRLLQAPLARALAACEQRVDTAGSSAPVAATAPTGGPLAELVRLLDGASAAPMPAGDTAAAMPPAELRAVRDFRRTWRRLSVDRQLSRSLAQAPENPGPLNSHGLMLRALQLMQAVSPGYLEHFVAQAETLLWLEQAQAGRPPAASGRGGDSKERQAGRRRKA